MRVLEVTLALAIAVIAHAAQSSATTYVVAPDGSGDFATIQAAIDAVEDGDIIELTDGFFVGAGNRDLDFLGKGIVVRSQSGSPEACVIYCQGVGRGFLFRSGEDSTSVLRGVTVRNGYSEYGAGMSCVDGGSPMIDNCIFSENEAAVGGGLHCSGSSPTFVNCIFTNNSATDFDRGSGGGAYCASESSVSFLVCAFSGNSALGVNMSGGAGGGVVCRDCVGVFDNCVFAHNFARFGGGLACTWYASVRLIDCVVIGNEAGAAGGMDCSDCFATLEGCVFLNNVASTLCGAVRCVGFAPAFSRCTFGQNTAEEGGVAGCYDSSPVFGSCTLACNSAALGGGLYCTASSFPMLENTIIALSECGEAVWCDGTSGATLTCCDLYGNADGDWVGCIADQYGVEGNISEDPLFCDPEKGDFTLQSGSPCLPGHNPECGLIGAWPIGCPASSVPGAPERSPTTLHLGRTAPNPFGSVTRITYVVPGVSSGLPVVLSVYDATGRLLRTLVDATHSSGTHTVSWDGTGDAGRPVEAGLYFYRLTVGGEGRTRSVLRIR